MPITTSRALVTHNFCPTWLQCRGLHERLPLRFNYLLEWLTELSETHLPVYYLIKDMIKDTDEQPNKEIDRVRSERVKESQAPELD